MRTGTFTITIPPNSGLGILRFDISTVGTPLDGLAQDAPLVVNAKQDIALAGATVGDAVVTVRASAPDTLRFSVRGAAQGVPIDLLVTEL